MSRHTLGACAEIGNAKAALCDKVPAGMSLEAAGVFARRTARPITRCCNAVASPAGEWVLVHGAAGGIGIAAIQVAKLFGAKVIATASTEAKRAACLEEGADHAIDYRGGFIDQVKGLTGGRGVDIVYDPIGDKVSEESLRCLAWGGRLLILGFLGGGPTNIRSNYLLIKGIEAIGVHIGGLTRPTPDLAIANMRDLTAPRRRGQAEAAHLPQFPTGACGRGGAGGHRPRGDRQGGAGGLTRRGWTGRGTPVRLPATVAEHGGTPQMLEPGRALPAADAGDPAFLGRHARRRIAPAALRRLRNVYFPPRPFCPACGSRKGQRVQGQRQGELYSYVINHRPVPGFTPPYAIAVVELAEGPRMMTNIVDCPQTPEALSSTCRWKSRSRSWTTRSPCPCSSPAKGNDDAHENQLPSSARPKPPSSASSPTCRRSSCTPTRRSTRWPIAG